MSELRSTQSIVVPNENQRKIIKIFSPSSFIYCVSVQKGLNILYVYDVDTKMNEIGFMDSKIHLVDYFRECDQETPSSLHAAQSRRECPCPIIMNLRSNETKPCCVLHDVLPQYLMAVSNAEYIPNTATICRHMFLDSVSAGLTEMQIPKG